MAKSKKEKSFVGVSITHDKINVVKLVNEDGDLYLKDYHKTNVPTGFIEDGVIVGTELIGQSLNKILTDSGISKTPINFTIPIDSIVAKVAEAPDLGKKDLRSYLRSNVEEHPIIIKYFQKDTSLLSEEVDEDDDEDGSDISVAFSSGIKFEEAEESRYFVLGAPGNLINSYKKTFAQAGESLASLSCDICGVISCLDQDEQSSDRVRLVVYMSDSCTEYVVVNGERVYFYHRAQYNSADILDHPYEVGNLIERTLMVLMAYQDRYPSDQCIDDVVVVGNSLELVDIFKSNIDDFKESLARDVVVYDPQEIIPLSGDIPKEQYDQEIYSLLPALGIALSQVRKKTVVDFIRGSVLFSVKDIKFTIAVFGVMVALFCAMYFGSTYYNKSMLTKLDNIKSQMSRTGGAIKFATQKQGQKAKLDKFEEVINTRVSRVEMLDILSEMLPEDLWFSSLYLKTSDNMVKFVIHGDSSSRYSVDAFLSTLRTYYTQVKLDSIKESSKGDVSFRITVFKRREKSS